MPMSFMFDFKRDMKMFIRKRAIICHSQHVYELFQSKIIKKKKRKSINSIVPKVVKWLCQKNKKENK